jgi:hypothetical protein
VMWQAVPLELANIERCKDLGDWDSISGLQMVLNRGILIGNSKF